jgi:hypothetical protein
MSEPAASSSSAITTSGRIVRAGLILLPVGTIVLGAASFGIWWYKKQTVEDRSHAYASALRREMTVPAVDRYVSILKEVLHQPDAERLPSVASFLESSMSSENMGYEPKRDRFYTSGVEVGSVEVELTGKQRPREVRFFLVPYGDRLRIDAEAHALAGLMALAHAMTGEREEVTVRFAAVPMGVVDQSGHSGLERLAAGMNERGERLMQVTVLGGAGEAWMTEIGLAFRAAQTGAVVRGLPETGDTTATMAAMSALKARR